MTANDNHRDDLRRSVLAVFVSGSESRFVPTLRSLRAVTDRPIVIGSPQAGRLAILEPLADRVITASSAADLVNRLRDETDDNLLVVSAPVLLPPELVERAEGVIAADLRIATVSAFSNAAGFLSFPNRNSPQPQTTPGYDEVSLSRRLRALSPEPRPAPIAIAAGAAVLLAGPAVSVIGPLIDGPSKRFDVALADFSLRGRQRGFFDLLDPGSYYSRPIDLANDNWETLLDDGDREWLQQRHPFALSYLEHEASSTELPMALAFSCARSKVLGLRVLIDGSRLGPHVMGTQVTLLAIIESLAERDDVAEVNVSLNQPVPRYARAILSNPKVRAEQLPAGDYSAFCDIDVAHRPFQPDDSFDIAAYRKVANRVVVSILDLIAYQIGSYHATADSWLQHRTIIRDAAGTVDAITTISQDVKTIVELEQLPIDPDRLHAIAYGTEHLTGNEQARIPNELLARGFVADEFLFCLGTNYSHKNRDLAVATLEELHRRGHDYALVLAGPSVPYGSSRVDESLAANGDGRVFVLPDVTTEERNWLLRHSSVVLYPTSAEGFGLVPYEAARFGTPTVCVGFGPLR